MQDIGKFTGNYLRMIGIISFVTMLVTMLYANFITINVTFILFLWAGSELRNHNPRARTWVIRLSILCILTIIATCTYIELMAIEKTSMDLFGIILRDMPRLLFYGTMAGLLVVCVIPLYLLLKGQARKEFSGNAPNLGDQ